MSRPIMDRLREALPEMTRRDEDTGCLLWLGTMTGSRRRHSNAKTRSTPTFHGQSVRRLLVAEKSGKPVPKGMRVIVKCDDPRCIEHAHFVVRQAGVHASIVTREHWRRNHAVRAAQNVAIMRSRSKVGSMEMAQRIRDAASSEEGAALAGISVATAAKIRAGKLWKKAVVPTSSIFALGESLGGRP